MKNKYIREEHVQKGIAVKNDPAGKNRPAQPERLLC